MTIDRVTLSRESHLEKGCFYQIVGEGEEGVGMLPLQVFRYEYTARMATSGTKLLVGTLFLKIWIGDRWFSIPPKKGHFLALHHVTVGEGSKLSSRHDFHLEKVEPKDMPKLLGHGRLYAEYIKSENEKAGRPVVENEGEIVLP
jgi:hypothetical protein